MDSKVRVTQKEPSIVKHLLDRDKIFTKELDPTKTKSSKHLEYEQNSKGTFIIDQNTNLENKRRLISLYATTTTQQDFISVVDVEFEEFVDAVPEQPTVDNTQVEDLSAENLTLKRRINQLSNQVSELETNIKNYPVVVNQVVAAVSKADSPQQVSDTLSVGSVLYSDRTGMPGAPNAPNIQNMLLSKNRKARLIIQNDGNVIITTGEFNERGDNLSALEEVHVFGWDNGETAPAFFTVAWNSNEKKESYIALGGLYPYYQHRWRTDFFRTGTQTKLVLDDYGNLNLFDKDRIVWSSYGMDPNQYFVNYQRPILLRDGSIGPGYNDAYKATLKSKVDTVTNELLATANSYRPASFQTVKNDVRARIELRRKLPYTDPKVILIAEEDITPTINASVTQTVLNRFTYQKPLTGPVSSPFSVPNGTYVSSLKNNITVTDSTGVSRVVFASTTPKQIEITWKQIAPPGTSTDLVKIYVTGSVQASSSYAYATFKSTDWTSINPLTPGIANVPYISAYIPPPPPPSTTTVPVTSSTISGVTPGTYLALLVNSETSFKKSGTSTSYTVFDRPKGFGYSAWNSTKTVNTIVINSNGTVSFTPKYGQIQGTINNFAVQGPFITSQWSIQSKVS